MKSSQSMSRRRLMMFRAIAVLFPFVLMAGGLEVCIRVRTTRWRQDILADKRTKGDFLCTRASANRDRIYELIPNKCDGINERGMPDRTRAVPTPPGTFRIVVVGDSVAVGFPFARRYAEMLEESLTTGRGRSVEVAVVAVTGYSTTQELTLASEVRRLEPDLVLWLYGINDAEEPVFDGPSAPINRFYDRPRSYALHFLSERLYRLRKKYYAWRGVCPEASIDDAYQWFEAQHCTSWDDVVANIAKIRTIGGANVPVVFGVFPLLIPESWDRPSAAKLISDLLAEGRRNGMTTLDFREAFAGVDPTTVSMPNDITHMNQQGHERFAAYLERVLPSLGLLGPP
jgi:hypothetical protein